MKPKNVDKNANKLWNTFSSGHNPMYILLVLFVLIHVIRRLLLSLGLN